MSKPKTLEGDLLARDLRIAVLSTRFNDFIVEHLVTGAMGALKRHGAEEVNLQHVRVPGAFELPVVAARLARSKRFDGIVALAAVIRGATPHFDYVAGECAKGLARVALDHDLPIGFGVLTVDTVEQAIERAGTKAGNKGAEAALSVIETANLLRELGG